MTPIFWRTSEIFEYRPNAELASEYRDPRYIHQFEIEKRSIPARCHIGYKYRYRQLKNMTRISSRALLPIPIDPNALKPHHLLPVNRLRDGRWPPRHRLPIPPRGNYSYQPRGCCSRDRKEAKHKSPLPLRCCESSKVGTLPTKRKYFFRKCTNQETKSNNF